ncbi:hypothetical protein ACJMK2_004745 [Sinanodonta woodiana]|uniref:Uncharacterized protein n=1 Tax=Sinanodonta woodiana TaxID=1069815 RepID=A0ABD3VNL7_SINWO
MNAINVIRDAVILSNSSIFIPISIDNNNLRSQATETIRMESKKDTCIPALPSLQRARINSGIQPREVPLALPTHIFDSPIKSSSSYDKPMETICEESKDVKSTPASPSPPRARINSGIEQSKALSAVTKESLNESAPIIDNDVISVGQVSLLPQLNLKQVISPKRLSGKRKIVSDITSNSPVKKFKAISTPIDGTAASKKGKKISFDSNMSTDFYRSS